MHPVALDQLPSSLCHAMGAHRKRNEATREVGRRLTGSLRRWEVEGVQGGVRCSIQPCRRRDGGSHHGGPGQAHAQTAVHRQQSCPHIACDAA